MNKWEGRSKPLVEKNLLCKELMYIYSTLRDYSIIPHLLTEDSDNHYFSQVIKVNINSEKLYWVSTDSILWWKRHSKNNVNFIWKVVNRCTFNAVYICGKDIPVWWLPCAKIKIHLVCLRHNKKKNKSGVEWARGKS